MKPDYTSGNLSELKKGDLFTHKLEQFNTVYYEFINFDGEYYNAKIFKKDELIKYPDDIIVMVVGKVSLANQLSILLKLFGPEENEHCREIYVKIRQVQFPFSLQLKLINHCNSPSYEGLLFNGDKLGDRKALLFLPK